MGRLVRIGVPLALVGILGALWLAAFNPINGLEPGTDSGVYLYMGQQMLDGAVPYRDVLDNKGPILYVLNAAGLAAGGGSLWGVYLLEYAVLAAAAVLGYVALRRRCGWIAAAAAVLLWILLTAKLMTGNHEEEWAMGLQLLVLFLWLGRPGGAGRAEGLGRPGGAGRPVRATSAWSYGLIGLLGAGAFLLKPVLIGLWLAIVVVLALGSLRGRASPPTGGIPSGGERPGGGGDPPGGAGPPAGESLRVARRTGLLQPLAALAAGAAAGLAIAAGCLLAAGAFGAFLDDFFVFNITYAGLYGWGDHLMSVVRGAGFAGWLGFAAAAVMWLLVLVRVWRRDGELDWLLLLAVVWLPIEVVLSSISGRNRVQYYLPWLAPIALLVAVTLGELRDRLRAAPGGAGSGTPATSDAVPPAGQRRRDPWVWALAVLVLCAFSGSILPTLNSARDLAGSVVHYRSWSAEKPGAPYRDMVVAVQQGTGPDDYVLVWSGYSADVNFLTERTSPTRYVTQLALYDPEYGADRVREFLADLEARPPAMILDASPSFGPEWGQAVPPLDSAAHPWRDAPPDFAAAWDDVFAHLQADYESEGALPMAPHWIVYRPRAQSVAAVGYTLLQDSDGFEKGLSVQSARLR